MLKKLENHSFIGVVLFVSVLFFGFTFRILEIESISSWGDEVASLYYAQHLDRVFFGESHTPFYYGLCRLWITIFPATIVSLRYMFISLSFVFAATSSFILYKKNTNRYVWLVFFTLVWLWPTDIIYSRQARHYSLYAEATLLILILWQYRSEFKKTLLWPVWSLFQLIHPFAIIPVWFLVIYDLVKKKSNWYELRFYLSTAFPLLCYYAVRFIFFGKEKVLSNIIWINNSSFTFLKSLGLLLVGDSFPLTTVYPLSKELSLLFLSVIIVLFLAFKKKDWALNSFEGFLKFIILFVLTFFLAEAGSAVLTNLRIGRYFIYLIPFLLYGLFQLVDNIAHKQVFVLSGLLMFVLSSYNVFVLKPWQFYEWDDQNVESFKQSYQYLPKKPLVVCANAFQLDYFFQRKYVGCSEAALRLHLAKTDFYLFDLTGNDTLLVVFLMNNAKIENYEKFNQALFISVSYPPTKSP